MCSLLQGSQEQGTGLITELRLRREKNTSPGVGVVVKLTVLGLPASHIRVLPPILMWLLASMPQETTHGPGSSTWFPVIHVGDLNADPGS